MAFVVHKFQQGLSRKASAIYWPYKKITHNINRSSIHSTPVTTRIPNQLSTLLFQTGYVKLTSRTSPDVKCQKFLQPKQDRTNSQERGDLGLYLLSDLLLASLAYPSMPSQEVLGGSVRILQARWWARRCRGPSSSDGGGGAELQATVEVGFRRWLAGRAWRRQQQWVGLEDDDGIWLRASDLGWPGRRLRRRQWSRVASRVGGLGGGWRVDEKWGIRFWSLSTYMWQVGMELGFKNYQSIPDKSFAERLSIQLTRVLRSIWFRKKIGACARDIFLAVTFRFVCTIFFNKTIF